MNDEPKYISDALLNFFRVEIRNEAEGGVSPATLQSAADSMAQAPVNVFCSWCEVEVERGDLGRELGRLIGAYQGTTQLEWLLEQTPIQHMKALLKFDLTQLKDDKFVDVIKGAAWEKGRTHPGIPIVGKLLGVMLEDAANGGDAETAHAIYEVFRRSHRTIQQGICRVFVMMLKEWLREVGDSKEMWVDARNEDSFQLAQSLEEQHLLHI